jgi:hypothetical protein
MSSRENAPNPVLHLTGGAKRALTLLPMIHAHSCFPPASEHNVRCIEWRFDESGFNATDCGERCIKGDLVSDFASRLATDT